MSTLREEINRLRALCQQDLQELWSPFGKKAPLSPDKQKELQRLQTAAQRLRQQHSQEKDLQRQHYLGYQLDKNKEAQKALHGR